MEPSEKAPFCVDDIDQSIPEKLSRIPSSFENLEGLDKDQTPKKRLRASSEHQTSGVPVESSTCPSGMGAFTFVDQPKKISVVEHSLSRTSTWIIESDTLMIKRMWHEDGSVHEFDSDELESGFIDLFHIDDAEAAKILLQDPPWGSKPPSQVEIPFYRRRSESSSRQSPHIPHECIGWLNAGPWLVLTDRPASTNSPHSFSSLVNPLFTILETLPQGVRGEKQDDCRGPSTVINMSVGTSASNLDMEMISRLVQASNLEFLQQQTHISRSIGPCLSGVSLRFTALKASNLTQLLATSQEEPFRTRLEPSAESARHSMPSSCVPFLRFLDISFTGIGDASMIPLAAALAHFSASMEVLVCNGNNVGVPGAKILAEGLRENKSIFKLDVSGNCFGDEGVDELARGLSHHPRLNDLRIDSCKVGVKGSHSLSTHLLRGSAPLERLSVGCNVLGSIGFAILEAAANASTGSRSLVRLDCQSNGILEFIEPPFGSMRTDCEGLRELVLSGNGLNDHGVETVTNALPFLPHLKDLRLGSNLLGIKGLYPLFKALPSSSISSLDLSGNPLDQASVWVISFALANDNQLEVLNLEGTLASRKVPAQHIALALLSNPQSHLRDLLGPHLAPAMKGICSPSLCNTDSLSWIKDIRLALATVGLPAEELPYCPNTEDATPDPCEDLLGSLESTSVVFNFDPFEDTCSAHACLPNYFCLPTPPKNLAEKAEPADERTMSPTSLSLSNLLMESPNSLESFELSNIEADSSPLPAFAFLFVDEPPSEPELTLPKDSESIAPISQEFLQLLEGIPLEPPSEPSGEVCAAEAPNTLIKSMIDQSVHTDRKDLSSSSSISTCTSKARSRAAAPSCSREALCWVSRMAPELALELRSALVDGGPAAMLPLLSRLDFDGCELESLSKLMLVDKVLITPCATTEANTPALAKALDAKTAAEKRAAIARSDTIIANQKRRQRKAQNEAEFAQLLLVGGSSEELSWLLEKEDQVQNPIKSSRSSWSESLFDTSLDRETKVQTEALLKFQSQNDALLRLREGLYSSLYRGAGSWSTKRVLVVDDSKVTRNLLRHLLHGQGFVIDDASDGFEALVMMQRRFYDVVFLDLEMPVMGGMDCVLKIREWEGAIQRRVHQRICAISTYTCLKEKRAVSSGFDHFLNKPIRAHVALEIASLPLIQPESK